MSLPFIDVPRLRPWPPRVSAFTKPFWDALAEGRLLTTRGRTSGRLTFPPKPFCPYDWAARSSGWSSQGGASSIRRR